MTVITVIEKIFKDGWLLPIKAQSDESLHETMSKLLEWIQSNPLERCPQYQFLRSRQRGKEIPIEYYSGDREKLLYYYKKMDSDDGYNIVGVEKYNQHCLFSLLKLKGWYHESMNEFFSVTYKDGREYNPTTKIPNDVRQLLPFSTYCYDIHAAYPSFIDLELGITRRRDIYELIEGETRDDKKITFNKTINTHKGITRKSIEELRSVLSKAYPGREAEVLTDECFNTQGLMFKRLVKYEQSYVERFAKENNIANYIRVHDGLLIAEDLDRPTLQFDNILFKYKELKLIHHYVPIWYYINDKKTLKISSLNLKKFYEMFGFVRLPSNQDKIEVARIQNRIVTPFQPRSSAASYLLSVTPENLEPMVSDLVSMTGDTGILSGFKLMNESVIDFYLDTENSFSIPFKNGLLKYTDKWEMIKYEDVKQGFFAAHETTATEFNIDFNEIEKRSTKSVVNQFCHKICKDDKGKYNNLIKIIGYLTHTYKNPADSPCIVLSDEGATNEDRKGRRGKGLLTKVIQHLRPMMEINGKDYSKENNFKLERLNNSHRVMLIDEAERNFDYKSLYTDILNPIKVERKFKGEEMIPFKLSPKIVITTNFIIPYSKEDTSTNERFCEFQVSDYFNGSDVTPVTEFGHLFFEDWTKEQWLDYFCFMAQCGREWIESDRKLPRLTTEKQNDTFRYLFYNEEIIYDFEKTLNSITDRLRIQAIKDAENPLFNASEAEYSFTATDFVKEYDLLKDKFKKSTIHIRNAAKLCHAYFENFPEIGSKYKYEVKDNVRKWHLIKVHIQK